MKTDQVAASTGPAILWDDRVAQDWLRDKSDPQFGQSIVLIALDRAATEACYMKRGTKAIMLLAFAFGLATVSAHAQGMGGHGRRRAQAPKANG
jgi:hypothetical protein